MRRPCEGAYCDFQSKTTRQRRIIVRTLGVDTSFFSRNPWRSRGCRCSPSAGCRCGRCSKELCNSTTQPRPPTTHSSPRRSPRARTIKALCFQIKCGPFRFARNVQTIYRTRHHLHRVTVQPTWTQQTKMSQSRRADNNPPIFQARARTTTRESGTVRVVSFDVKVQYVTPERSLKKPEEMGDRPVPQRQSPEVSTISATIRTASIWSIRPPDTPVHSWFAGSVSVVFYWTLSSVRTIVACCLAVVGAKYSL